MTPPGWFVNPIDEDVMGPARQLAADRVMAYQAYHAARSTARRDHMNRIVTIDPEHARRAIAMRVLASLVWLSRR